MANSHAVLRISLTLVVNCIYFINLPVVNRCPNSGRTNTTSETHTCKTPLLYSTRIVLVFAQVLPAVFLLNYNADSILVVFKFSGAWLIKTDVYRFLGNRVRFFSVGPEY